VRLVRELRPHVIPAMMRKRLWHPDHIQVHRMTVAAFHAAGAATQYPEIGLPPGSIQAVLQRLSTLLYSHALRDHARHGAKVPADRPI